MILLAPKTLEQLAARLADESVEKMDFYLALRPSPYPGDGGKRHRSRPHWIREQFAKN